MTQRPQKGEGVLRKAGGMKTADYPQSGIVPHTSGEGAGAPVQRSRRDEAAGAGRGVHSDRRFGIINCLKLDFLQEMKKDVRHGLSQPQKSVPAKYFYDARGSRLFDRICGLPEYYPTRTEMAVLRAHAPRIMAFFFGREGSLVEIGCGSDAKIRRLLDGTDPRLIGGIRYVPIDISASCLMQTARRLTEDYRNLQVLGIIADFTRHLDHLPRGPKLIAFLGGTFGNFPARQGAVLLERLAAVMTPEDRLLLGLDMLKAVPVMEAAYNDTAGVTAAFNLNVLHHLNNRLGADFIICNFSHRAFFNPERERIEMHLRALKDQRVTIDALEMTIHMAKGETIHTENCQKFSRRSAMQRFGDAGLHPTAWYADAREWFSLVELRVA